MSKLLASTAALGGCLLLAGCPIVKSVQGSATAPQTKFSATRGWHSEDAPVRTDQQLAPGTLVKVSPEGSVAITAKGTDGKDCDLTYYADFIVVEPVDCRKQREKNEKQRKQRQDEKQQEQQDPQRQGEDDGSPDRQPQGNAGQGQPGQQDRPPQGVDGNASGIGGPPVIGTAVPSYGHFLENVLSIAGAVGVANEIRKRTDGDGDEDGPLSK